MAVVAVVYGGSLWREQSPDINHTFLAAPWPKYQQSIRPCCCVIVVADRLPLPYAAQTGASCFGQRHHLSTKSISVATACLSCAFLAPCTRSTTDFGAFRERDQRASRHRLLVAPPPLRPPNHRRSMIGSMNSKRSCLSQPSSVSPSRRIHRPRAEHSLDPLRERLSTACYGDTTAAHTR